MEVLDVDGNIKGNKSGKVWAGFMWLRLGTSGELF